MTIHPSFRSSDGSMLVASSSDGYCTIVHFKEGELGVPYSLSVKQALERSNSPLLQTSDTSGNLRHLKLEESPASNIFMCTIYIELGYSKLKCISKCYWYRNHSAKLTVALVNII